MVLAERSAMFPERGPSFFGILGALLFVLGAPLPLQAQTAKEFLDNGFFAFSSQDYVKAEAQLSRFVQDYGKSPEAAEWMEQAMRLLAVARLKQDKFGPALETMERYLKEYPQGSKAEDFSFWMGVSQLRSDDPAKADASFANFIQKYPQSPRLKDAQFSRGLCLLQQDKFKEVAEYYPPLYAQLKPEQAYQARVMSLYALIETAKLDEAFLALGEIDPQSEAAGKIAAYHLLALDLGNKLLEKEDYRRSLGVLQRVWSKTRILTRQKARLEKMKADIAKLDSARSPDESYELVVLKDMAAQVEKEVAQLEKIGDYDTALQFRIGQCFFQLERPREAYLSMKEMLGRLPDTELLASANYTMLICLTRMERWNEAIAAATDFEKRFAKAKELPNVLYLKAEAYQRLYDYANAHVAFMEVAKRFPDYSQSARCRFLAGYALLMQDKNKEAWQHFEDLLKNHQKSPFVEQSLYWQSMALHFNKEYPQSREAFAAYLKAYPKGTHAADATYRRAQALFNQKLFTEAYKELEDFLKKNPGSAPEDEALNLLGDAYLALGEVDRGLASYRKVSKRDGKLYDYGVFRSGLAYKALEQYDVMAKHFETFLQERKESTRVSEALAQLAWVERRREKPEKARDIYWDAIRRYGNDPEAFAVEDMMRTLSKMYRTPEEKADLMNKWSELGEQARSGQKKTQHARTLWIRAALAEKNEPEKAAAWRLEMAGAAPARELSPQMLGDAADQLRLNQRAAEAQELYQTILSWYPRSLMKDRAYAGLGLLAMQQGNEARALEYFSKFEKESVQSPLLADVLKARAGLYLQRGREDEAVKELERILEVKSAKGRPWVEALYQIGEIRLKQNDPKKAIPYFQRIYVMYARWSDMVAKAYWQSGQAFEQLNMQTEAMNTYREFVGQQHLENTPEYQKAQQRLKRGEGA